MHDEVIIKDCHVTDGVAVLRFSGGELLELAADSLPPDFPGAGAAVSPEMLLELRLAAERKKVARSVFRMLDRRLYSAASLRNKLADRGFSDDSVDRVLEEFEKRGLHSDRRFAEAFCRDTLRRKPVGRLYLLSRLYEQKIARSTAELVVAAELTPEREKAMALAAAATRWRRHSGGIDYRARTKVQRFLHSRGFPAGMIRSAVDQTEPRPGDESNEGLEDDL